MTAFYPHHERDPADTTTCHRRPCDRVPQRPTARSTLADLLPSLRETGWLGLSAGSMVMTPSIGEDFVAWKPPTGRDSTLGIVDFSIFPHLDHELLPENTMADAERWAAEVPGPAYAIDDETAIRVTDGTVDVVSEGHWKLFSS